MKLLYATSIKYPSRYANRIQTWAMAEEFGKTLGAQFFLGGHDIKRELSRGNVVNIKGSTKSLFLAFRYLLFMRNTGITHVFCREDRLLFFIILYNKIFFRLSLKFFYEIHYLPEKHDYRFAKALAWADGLISISNATRNMLIERGMVGDKIIVAPDGVNLESFENLRPREQVLPEYSLPTDKKIVMYAGLFDDWKGYRTLLEASRHFDTTHVVLVMVGGKPEQVTALQSEYPQVHFTGYLSADRLPELLKASDILVIPNSARFAISKYYTSPLKLFSYMAAGKPIVASDLPSLREILNEKNAVLVLPDDAGALFQGISTVLANEVWGSQLGARAYQDVQNYTWQKRAGAILTFIKKRTNIA